MKHFILVATIMAGIFAARGFFLMAQEKQAEASLRIEISVDGAATETDLVSGSPLLIESLFAAFEPDEDAAWGTVEIRSETGTWMDAVSFLARDEKGEKQAWPVQPAPQTSPEAAVQLYPGESIYLAWILSPEASGAIPPGGYEVIAEVALGENQKVTSNPILVRVTGEQISGQKDATRRRTLAYLSLTGKHAEARGYVEEDLSKAPDNAELWALKGDFLKREGKYEEALDAYDAALEIYERKPGDMSHPLPLPLLQKQREVMHALLFAGPFKGPDMIIRLEWKTKANVDLWVENQDGSWRPPVEDITKGPGMEVYRPRDYEGSEEDEMYYAAAYLIDAPEGEKTEVTMTIEISGKDPVVHRAVLDYDEGRTFWIAVKIDNPTGEITDINVFDDSVQNYLESASAVT